MKTETVDQNLNARKSCRIRLRSPLILVAFGVIVAAVVLNRPATNVPIRSQGPIAHAGWYLRNRMWQADARTLLATVRYLVAPETSSSNAPALAVSRLPDGGVPNPRALASTVPDTATNRSPAGVARGQSASGEPS